MLGVVLYLRSGITSASLRSTALPLADIPSVTPPTMDVTIGRVVQDMSMNGVNRERTEHQQTPMNTVVLP